MILVSMEMSRKQGSLNCSAQLLDDKGDRALRALRCMGNLVKNGTFRRVMVPLTLDAIWEINVVTSAWRCIPTKEGAWIRKL